MVWHKATSQQQLAYRKHSEDKVRHSVIHLADLHRRNLPTSWNQMFDSGYSMVQCSKKNWTRTASSNISKGATKQRAWGIVRQCNSWKNCETCTALHGVARRCTCGIAVLAPDGTIVQVWHGHRWSSRSTRSVHLHTMLRDNLPGQRSAAKTCQNPKTHAVYCSFGFQSFIEFHVCIRKMVFDVHEYQQICDEATLLRNPLE